MGEPIGEGAILRKATSSDGAAIAELFLRSRKQAMPWLAIVHTDEETREWVRNVVLVHRHVWIAEKNKQLLGFAALDNGWLEHLYIDSDMGGQGIGRSLLDTVKQNSPDGLQLYVFDRNTRARQFYERAGFTLIDKSDGSRNEENEPDCSYAWIPKRRAYICT